MPVKHRRLRALAIVIVAGVLSLLGVGALFPRIALDAEFARLRWLADARERAIEVDGARVVYLEAGTDAARRKPMLVLLHGFTGAKENWLALMPHLSARWHVIAPDLPGWGDSQRKANADYGYAAQAERVARFVQALDGGNAVTLVGHSMGGGIAAIVAARYPVLIEKLVLMDAGGVRFDENEFGLAVLRGENPFAVDDVASLERNLSLVFEQPPYVPWPADRALIARRIADRPFEDDVLGRIGRGPEAFLPGQEATAIRAPTLLLWCEHDRVIDASAAQLYAGAIRGSHVQMLQGCNHMPMMERPAQTAAALGEFLQ